MKNILFNERGFSHIIIAAVALAVVGIGGWLVIRNSDKPPANASTEAVREALKNATCDLDDKNVCKFLTSWKASRYYTARTTTTVGRTTNTSIVKADGENYYAKINSELPHETISIGSTLYTKDTEKNMWYKQTLEKPSTTGFTFDESKLENDGKLTYKKVGKEKCGELTCFKYQVILNTDRGLKQFVWFDDQDYQLRKQTTEQEGSKTSTTFNYDKVTITEPSPYTELRKGEIYLPGQGVISPSGVPGGTIDELNKLLEQYRQ